MPRDKAESDTDTFLSVPNAEEMETCKREIAKLVLTIVDWQWGGVQHFGERRVRRGTIAYVDNSGQPRVGPFTCTFDEPPVGDDFFIEGG
jgi:hypothetical protein